MYGGECSITIPRPYWGVGGAMVSGDRAGVGTQVENATKWLTYSHSKALHLKVQGFSHSAIKLIFLVNTTLFWS